MRLDRIITLGLFAPVRRLGRAAEGPRRTLPVLMYHSVSEDKEEGVRPYYRTAVSPRRFEEQMEWIAETGARGVTLSEGLRLLEEGGAHEARTVALTFDDGFRDFYTSAHPVLQRHRFSATMYLATGYIGEERSQFNSFDCMTWAEVRELQGAGIEFGTHSVTHPELHALPLGAVADELARSKGQLEERLRVEAAHFAYPYAFPQEDGPFTAVLSELLRAQGYRTCVTTRIGRVEPGDDPYRLKRLPVNQCDDRALFVAKLGGAYDWLAVPQLLTRCAKSYARRARSRRGKDRLPAPSKA